MKSFYDLTADDINNNPIPFSNYKGLPLIVTNVATMCKLTKSNYESFVNLLNKYHNKGLRILLFPCNQYMNQESGDIESIKAFVDTHHKNFILFNKVNVFGSKKHPVFEYLTKHGPGTLFNFVKWNFTKWLIDRDGNVVKRYGPNDLVKDEDVEKIVG